MISLREALTRKNSNVVPAVAMQAAEQFMQNYTNLKPKWYTIDQTNDGIVINTTRSFEISGWEGEKLTDGFILGPCKELTVSDCPNLTSAKEFPEMFTKLSIVNCPKLEELPQIPVKCSDIWLCNVGIRNLKGCPTALLRGSIGVDRCDNFESLEGAPKNISGSMEISKCPKFSSLKGCPSVGKGKPNDREKLDVCECPIKSLEGINIDKFNGAINLCDCNELVSLKGIPSKEVESLILHRCHSIESLDFLPEKVPHSIICHMCDSLESAGALHKILKKYKNADEIQSALGEFYVSLCPINKNSAELSKLEKAGIEVDTDVDTGDSRVRR